MSKSEIRFRMASFSFLSRLMRKRVEKSEAIIVLLDDSFQCISNGKPEQLYPASRGFPLVFLSVVLPFSSRFWLLAFCFGCFCAEEKTSADRR